MIFGNSRAFWHMVFVSATGVPTFMTTYYYYQLLTQIGLLLAVPIGFFLTGQFCLGFWLLKHPNPTFRTAGKAFESVLMYLALFEGLILTVLVFYLLGGETTGGPAAFAADFVIGATYLSMFIYGAVGVPNVLVAERLVGKLACYLYGFVALVPPFWLVFFQEAAIRTFVATHSGTLLLLALSYYMAMSAIGMWLMLGPMTDAKDPTTDKGDV